MAEMKNFMQIIEDDEDKKLLVIVNADQNILDHQINLINDNKCIMLLTPQIIRKSEKIILKYDLSDFSFAFNGANNSSEKLKLIFKGLLDLENIISNCEGNLIYKDCLLLNKNFIFRNNVTGDLFLLYIPIKRKVKPLAVYKRFILDIIEKLDYSENEQIIIQKLINFVQKDEFSWKLLGNYLGFNLNSLDRQLGKLEGIQKEDKSSEVEHINIDKQEMKFETNNMNQENNLITKKNDLELTDNLSEKVNEIKVKMDVSKLINEATNENNETTNDNTVNSNESTVSVEKEFSVAEYTQKDNFDIKILSGIIMQGILLFLAVYVYNYKMDSEIVNKIAILNNDISKLLAVIVGTSILSLILWNIIILIQKNSNNNLIIMSKYDIWNIPNPGEFESITNNDEYRNKLSEIVTAKIDNFYEYPYLETEYSGTYERIFITKPVFNIGNKFDKADYFLEKDDVNEVHARIFIDDNKYYIVDLSKTNATLVNNKKISVSKKISIYNNDKIVLADKLFTFNA